MKQKVLLFTLLITSSTMADSIGNVSYTWQQPIFQFCRQNTWEVLKENGYICREFPWPGSAVNPWNCALFPSEKKRLLGLTKNMYLQTFGLQNLEEVRAALQSGVFSKRPDTDLTFDVIRSWKKLQIDGNDLGFWERTTLCAMVQIRDSINCARALDQVIKIASPIQGRSSDYVFVDTLEEIFSNNLYVEGASRAAIRILNRISNGIVDDSNLLRDLVESYVESGLWLTKNLVNLNIEDQKRTFIAGTNYFEHRNSYILKKRC